jgi:hypothetical protein
MQRSTVSWNGKAVKGQTDTDVVRGLLMAAEWLVGEASAIVPIDEGNLDRSGVASVDRATLTSAASFDTPYAVKQHENLHYRHAPGRQAKYLEEPWTQGAPTMLQIIAVQARKGMRR